MPPVCNCGCGESTARGTFLPGHDQKLRTELERRVGGLSAMRTLVENAEGFAAGRLSADELGLAVAIVMREAGRPQQAPE
jgi:hypothetical protein